mmetsp:Transcript_36247/g.47976  ORF Transcript_36247/g.47976 Transcript_36247/m.47976 type:complete len:129 (+) Transcript_36247:282-668(+)
MDHSWLQCGSQGAWEGFPLQTPSQRYRVLNRLCRSHRRMRTMRRGGVAYQNYTAAVCRERHVELRYRMAHLLREVPEIELDELRWEKLLKRAAEALKGCIIHGQGGGAGVPYCPLLFLGRFDITDRIP